MADPFVAEIRIFPFNFVPKGWAWCDGQILSLSQNTALFSLLGTTYGGNGISNFALPNLQGRAPMAHGQGPGLSQRDLGETGGSATVTLLESEMPAHSHALRGTNETGTQGSLSSSVALSASVGGTLYRDAPDMLMPMASESLAPAGGGSPHNNMMPYLTLNFCIALQGLFPPR